MNYFFFWGGPAADKQDPLQSKLNKVEQLTGFSDPVYAEAYVNVNQYDIVLDVLVVNQTADTLQVWSWLKTLKMTSELQKKKWKQSWKNLEFLTFFWSKYFKRRMEYRLTSDLIGFHYSYYNQNNKYLHLYML